MNARFTVSIKVLRLDGMVLAKKLVAKKTEIEFAMIEAATAFRVRPSFSPT